MQVAITGVKTNVFTVLIDHLLRLTLCFGVVRFFEKVGTFFYSYITLKTNISVGYKHVEDISTVL